MKDLSISIRWGPALCVGLLLIAGSLMLTPKPAAGDLLFLESHRDGLAGVEGLDQVRWVAVSPDGAHVYTASEHDGAVALFRRDAATGRLTFVKAYVNGQDGVDGLAGACWVALSPDGDHLYASGLTEGTVAVFARSAASGELTLVEVQRDGVDGVDGIAGAREVTVSPDGANVYVAGMADSAVAVFARDSETGALTLLEREQQGVGGVEGLTDARTVSVSPDGAHVYASGYNDIAVALFERDPLTGMLTFVEATQNGENGVTGLVGVTHLTLSPDGQNLYAGARLTGSVVLFGRDAVTGKLTYLETQSNGSGGLTKLAIPLGLAVSPDGGTLYVASSLVDAVVVFVRDPISGLLSCAAEQTEGLGNDSVNGDEPAAVAVSPDSRHVYVAVQVHGSLSAFAVVPHLCCGDGNWDGKVTIDELVRAVNNAMDGCIESMEH